MKTSTFIAIPIILTIALCSCSVEANNDLQSNETSEITNAQPDSASLKNKEQLLLEIGNAVTCELKLLDNGVVRYTSEKDIENGTLISIYNISQQGEVNKINEVLHQNNLTIDKLSTNYFNPFAHTATTSDGTLFALIVSNSKTKPLLNLMKISKQDDNTKDAHIIPLDFFNSKKEVCDVKSFKMISDSKLYLSVAFGQDSGDYIFDINTEEISPFSGFVQRSNSIVTQDTIWMVDTEKNISDLLEDQDGKFYTEMSDKNSNFIKSIAVSDGISNENSSKTIPSSGRPSQQLAGGGAAEFPLLLAVKDTTVYFIDNDGINYAEFNSRDKTTLLKTEDCSLGLNDRAVEHAVMGADEKIYLIFNRYIDDKSNRELICVYW